jgi:hypothetical protein
MEGLGTNPIRVIAVLAMLGLGWSANPAEAARREEPGSVPVAASQPQAQAPRPEPVVVRPEPRPEPVATTPLLPHVPSQVTTQPPTQSSSGAAPSRPGQQGNGQPGHNQTGSNQPGNSGSTPYGDRGYVYPGYGYGYPYGWNNGQYYTPYNNDSYPESSTGNAPAAPAPVGLAPVAFVPGPAPLVPADTGPSPIALAARARNAVNKDPQMMAATEALATAQLDYNLARQRVIDALMATPAFRQAFNRKQEAEDQLDSIRATTGLGPEFLQAAEQKMQASDQLTKLTERAVAADPAANDAKAKLLQASQDRSTLEAQLLKQFN